MKKQKPKQNLYKDIRYARYLASMEPREDPSSEKSPRSRAKI